jgi:ribosomal protein S18 acetylase RimI-like enzyme
LDAAPIETSRRRDAGSEPRDHRLAAYMGGTHNPQDSLAPRTTYVALIGGEVVGYVAGHLTRRFGCDGEVQHLWVAPAQRQRGIGSELLRRQRSWFAAQGAEKVCVNVAVDNAPAQAFFRRHGAQNLREHWLAWGDVTGAA